MSEVQFEKSEKSWNVTMLLTWLLGGLGAHRFYLGKTGTGIAMLLTGGGCGIWALIDWFTMLFGTVTDKDGKVITK